MLVVNHPLFPMAVHDRYALMEHPLSRSLLSKKFKPFSLFLFIFGCVLYSAFLGIFTTIVLRTNPPQYYYNLTDFDFKSDLCRNVTAALGNTAARDNVDAALRIGMYVVSALLIFKNLWFMIGYARIAWWKTLTFFIETVALAFSYYFIFDHDHQKHMKIRCPIQWQIGACGLFLVYIASFFYVQYIPLIGLYVIMLRVIVIRFLLVLPMLLILVSMLALIFYMLFENFETFQSGLVDLTKTGILRSFFFCCLSEILSDISPCSNHESR